MRAKQIIKFIRCVLVIAITLTVTPLYSSGASNVEFDDPEQIVNNLQNSLFQAMREGDQLSYQERFDFLAPIIDQSLNLGFIIRSALGSSWSKLDQDQKSLITDVFRQLSIATYASRFNEYGGEKFKIVEQRVLPRNQSLVRSQLIEADGGTINFDYVLQQEEGQWRIVNILIDGVSDLALKRAEYRAILQRDGFPALIEMIKKKIIVAEQNQ